MIIPQDQIFRLRIEPIEERRPCLKKRGRKLCRGRFPRLQLEIPLQEQVQLNLKRFAAVIRDVISRAAGQGQIPRWLRGADGKQPIHSVYIEQFEMRAPSDELAENGVAQIFHEKEARSQIARENSGRAYPGFAA